jgi:hypothetical protein
MGIVVEFPADIAARRARSDEDTASHVGTATIVILPAIRIERYTEEVSGGMGPEKGTASGRRRKRRARS